MISRSEPPPPPGEGVPVHPRCTIGRPMILEY
ncbi:hypothetical protein CGRA01v4_08358 [Colletotrichum graminicola]|nr:hypothetical protein CGRA01v4_08358 [Colletotrichum graminicola]